MAAELLGKVKNFLGFDPIDDDEYYEGEELHAAEELPVAEKSQRTVVRPAAPSGAPSRPNNIIGLPSNPSSEMVVIEPRSFDEALAILDNLRSRKAVILNLVGLAPDQSQRLVDFVSGACHALDGHQEKIGESIFLFTPSNVVINTFHAERDWMGAQAAAPKDLFWKVR